MADWIFSKATGELVIKLHYLPFFFLIFVVVEFVGLVVDFAFFDLLKISSFGVGLL